MANEIQTELKLLDDNMTLIQEKPASIVFRTVHQYAWVVTILAILLAVSGIYRCYKIKRQNADEKDIKNMFNEDGTKNEHYDHKDYDPLPCFVFAAVLFIVRLLIAAL